MPGRVKVSNPGLSFFTDEPGRESDRLVEVALLHAFATLKGKLLQVLVLHADDRPCFYVDKTTK